MFLSADYEPLGSDLDVLHQIANRHPERRKRLSVIKLSAESGYCEKTVRTCIKRLRRAGLIIVEREHSAGVDYSFTLQPASSRYLPRT